MNNQHKDLIQAAIKQESKFLSCSWSDRIVSRGKQRFAVFGDIAYELLPFESAEEKGTRFEYYPVILDGRMFRMDPDEGRGGMLYILHMTSRRGEPTDRWSTSFLQTGWLYVQELELSNEEILENIAEEIQAGENVLTRKPQGWA